MRENEPDEAICTQRIGSGVGTTTRSEMKMRRGASGQGSGREGVVEEIV